MSDPIARYYEVVIHDELNRQIRMGQITERTFNFGGGSVSVKNMDVRALAAALAKEATPSDQHPLHGLLEPRAERYDVQTSQAISLKRIADVLATGELVCRHPAPDASAPSAPSGPSMILGVTEDGEVVSRMPGYPYPDDGAPYRASEAAQQAAFEAQIVHEAAPVDSAAWDALKQDSAPLSAAPTIATPGNFAAGRRWPD